MLFWLITLLNFVNGSGQNQQYKTGLTWLKSNMSEIQASCSTATLPYHKYWSSSFLRFAHLWTRWYPRFLITWWRTALDGLQRFDLVCSPVPSSPPFLRRLSLATRQYTNWIKFASFISLSRRLHELKSYLESLDIVCNIQSRTITTLVGLLYCLAWHQIMDQTINLGQINLEPIILVPCQMLNTLPLYLHGNYMNVYFSSFIRQQVVVFIDAGL